MKTIITIQHTQSEHHVNGMVGSWTDWNLTEQGRLQAERIGGKLRDEIEGGSFVMYSSDLKRAAQTADIVGGCLGIRPVLRRELRERNLGRCCGKSVEWLRANMEAPEKTVDDRLFSDGESRREEWNRLRPFFDEVMGSGDERIIIVSHGDLLEVFNAMFLGLEVEDLERIGLAGMSGGVTHMAERDGRRRITRLSDMWYAR